MQKITYILIIAVGLILTSCKSNKLNYFANSGEAHGTFYNIQYKYTTDIQDDIEEQTRIVDTSLSTYITTSIISQINQDKENVILDSLFIKVFNCGKQVYKKTKGAFDMTVTPIVNAWGFGFTDSTHVDSTIIDSLLQYVGFDMINIENNHIIKSKKGIMLDGSAIAKGFSIDYVSEYLESLGIKNYLVEIGGEVRTKGVNKYGEIWTVGIDKPIFDETASKRELQDTISLKNISIATSGNYRQFYMRNNIMYSHTINPKTGYPVKHSILSASVIAPNCMTADAYATAFMVLGVEKALKIANANSNLEIYVIYTDKQGNISVKMTDGFKKYILHNK